MQTRAKIDGILSGHGGKPGTYYCGCRRTPQWHDCLVSTGIASWSLSYSVRDRGSILAV